MWQKLAQDRKERGKKLKKKFLKLLFIVEVFVFSLYTNLEFRKLTVLSNIKENRQINIFKGFNFKGCQILCKVNSHCNYF